MGKNTPSFSRKEIHGEACRDRHTGSNSFDVVPTDLDAVARAGLTGEEIRVRGCTA